MFFDLDVFLIVLLLPVSFLCYTLKCIQSVTGTQSLHSILSFEFKSDYITSNYKVLTIINISVHVCVDITVKLQKPNSFSSCLFGTDCSPCCVHDKEAESIKTVPDTRRSLLHPHNLSSLLEQQGTDSYRVKFRIPRL